MIRGSCTTRRCKTSFPGWKPRQNVVGKSEVHIGQGLNCVIEWTWEEFCPATVCAILPLARITPHVFDYTRGEVLRYHEAL